MASIKSMKSQVGLQTTHGTAVDPTMQVPHVVRYEDQRQIHLAEYDAGTWTPSTLPIEVATLTALNVEGQATFETLPVFLNSSITDDDATGADPYAYAYVYTPTAVHSVPPVGTTWLVGAVGTNIGGTGPAVKLKDVYFSNITLSGNINDKVVQLKATGFGTTIDDNSGAGFAFIAAASAPFPAAMEFINPLSGTLNIQDADTATGGNFLTMTAFSCSMLDWEWSLDTGAQPLYCTDDSTTSFSGLRYQDPVCTFKPVIRTNSTNYALIKTKHAARTYQELQYILAGAATRALTINMTGRWTEVLTVHEEQDGELVIKPTFTCETPHTQVTTPHWLALALISKLDWEQA